MLSKPPIQRHFDEGGIVIDPFDPRNLKSTQYDVTLGEWYYQEVVGPGYNIYNPYDEDCVRRNWGIPQQASLHADLVRDWLRGFQLKNIGLDERVILLRPGEMILAHTVEFIGGAMNNITTKMNARSSSGRNYLEVCRCAGKGDVGFFNRWTMEIVNTSRYHTIPLVCGRRIAQIEFYEVEAVAPEDMYSFDGKYQGSASLEEAKAAWKPDMMLPKMWLDREVAEKKSTRCEHGINHSGERHGCDGCCK